MAKGAKPKPKKAGPPAAKPSAKKPSPFLDDAVVAQRLAAMEESYDQRDLDQLASALTLLIARSLPAPVWLCLELAKVIDELRDQQSTGQKGPRSTRARVIALNQRHLRRYAVVQRIKSESKQQGKILPMKKIYFLAASRLNEATDQRGIRAVQESCRRIAHEIASNALQPHEYCPEDPELVLEMIGKAIQK